MSKLVSPYQEDIDTVLLSSTDAEVAAADQLNLHSRLVIVCLWKELNKLDHPILEVGWLVGCFGFNGPLRQYFSLYRAVSQREGEREEKRIDESKNVQTTPARTYYKRSRPLP